VGNTLLNHRCHFSLGPGGYSKVIEDKRKNVHLFDLFSVVFSSFFSFTFFTFSCLFPLLYFFFFRFLPVLMVFPEI